MGGPLVKKGAAEENVFGVVVGLGEEIERSRTNQVFALIIWDTPFAPSSTRNGILSLMNRLLLRVLQHKPPLFV